MSSIALSRAAVRPYADRSHSQQPYADSQMSNAADNALLSSRFSATNPTFSAFRRSTSAYNCSSFSRDRTACLSSVSFGPLIAMVLALHAEPCVVAEKGETEEAGFR